MRADRLLTTGGSIAAAVVICLIINMVGSLPTFFSSHYDTEYRARVYSGESAARPTDLLDLDGGIHFRCRWQDAGERHLADVSCAGLDSDGSGLTQFESALKKAGWIVVSDAIDMDMSIAPEAWLVAITALLFCVLGGVLIRHADGGWAWYSPHLSRWWIVPLLLLPSFSAALVVTIGGWFLNGAPVSSEATVHVQRNAVGVSLGALLFMLLPVIAAFPEEALFRGWLHGRLFRVLPDWLAYVLIAEIFVLMHVSLAVAAFGSGLSGKAALVQLAAIFGVSLTLTWIRRVSDSIPLCVAAHAVNNTVAIAAFYVAA